MSENDRALDLRLPRAGGNVATEEITNFLESLRTLLAQRVARLEVMYAGLEDQYDQIDQVTVLDVISVTVIIILAPQLSRCRWEAYPGAKDGFC